MSCNGVLHREGVTYDAAPPSLAIAEPRGFHHPELRALRPGSSLGPGSHDFPFVVCPTSPLPKASHFPVFCPIHVDSPMPKHTEIKPGHLDEGRWALSVRGGLLRQRTLKVASEMRGPVGVGERQLGKGGEVAFEMNFQDGQNAGEKMR